MRRVGVDPAAASVALAAGLIAGVGMVPASVNGARSVPCWLHLEVQGQSAAMPGGSGAAFTDPAYAQTVCGRMAVRVIYTTSLGGTRYYTSWHWGVLGQRVTSTTTHYIVGGSHDVEYRNGQPGFPFTT